MAYFDIVGGSCCDMSNEWAEKNDIKIVNYSFFIDGKEYLDDFCESLSLKDFCDKLRAGSFSTTSMINTEKFEAAFRPSLEAGRDLIFVSLSSGLSGSYNNALLVKEKLENEFPGRKVYILDAMAATICEGLIIEDLAEMRAEGKSAEEVYAWAEANVRKYILWFTVNNLDYLRRGGRITRASAFLGTMLNIKPVLMFDDTGRIVPVEKIRGRKKALQELVNKMEGQLANPEGGKVFIGNADAIEDAEYLKSLIQEKYPKIGPIYIGNIGPVITTHVGAETISLHYFGNGREISR